MENPPRVHPAKSEILHSIGEESGFPEFVGTEN